MGAKRNSVARTATEALRILWEDGFFRSWKKWAAIVADLDKRGNHFSDAELGMALKRAKHLTRRGKKGGYLYIQRFPHVPEDEDRVGRKEA